LRYAYLGLLKYHLSEVGAIMSILPEIRHNSEVARRLYARASQTLQTQRCYGLERDLQIADNLLFKFISFYSKKPLSLQPQKKSLEKMYKQ